MLGLEVDFLPSSLLFWLEACSILAYQLQASAPVPRCAGSVSQPDRQAGN